MTHRAYSYENVYYREDTNPFHDASGLDPAGIHESYKENCYTIELEAENHLLESIFNQLSRPKYYLVA